jgi:muconolactone delta-isomerase
MHLYLLDITFKESLSEDFLLLIHKQRVKINELISKGKIISYSLAEDRSKLWVVMLCNKELEVSEIVNSFPLREYMDFEIYKLAFSQNSISKMIPLSLN